MSTFTLRPDATIVRPTDEGFDALIVERGMMPPYRKDGRVHLSEPVVFCEDDDPYEADDYVPIASLDESDTLLLAEPYNDAIVLPGEHTRDLRLHGRAYENSEEFEAWLVSVGATYVHWSTPHGRPRLTCMFGGKQVWPDLDDFVMVTATRLVVVPDYIVGEIFLEQVD